MLSNLAVRTKSRLIIRSRILAALKSARREQGEARRSRSASQEGTVATHHRHALQRSRTLGRPRQIRGQLSDFLKDIYGSTIAEFEEYRKLWLEDTLLALIARIYVKFFVMCSLTYMVMISFAPILLDWPPILKADIKEGVWAIRREDAKNAIPHLSRAWLRVQSLPPEMLSSDPNLKILKVACLLAVALIHDGQRMNAVRVLSDALNLRSRRRTEELRKASLDDGARQPVSVCKEEKILVLSICLCLHKEDKDNREFWLAQAYAESARFIRTLVANSEKLVSNSIYSVPLKVYSSQLGLDRNDPILCGIDEQERCHDGTLQDLFFDNGFVCDEPSAAIRLTLNSVELMADFCEKLNDPWISFTALIGGILVMGKAKKDNLLSVLVLRIYNRFIRSVFDMYGREPPVYVKIELPDLESIREQFESMRKHLGFLALLPGSENPINQELSMFYVLYGRLCLVLGLFVSVL